MKHTLILLLAFVMGLGAANAQGPKGKGDGRLKDPAFRAEKATEHMAKFFGADFTTAQKDACYQANLTRANAVQAHREKYKGEEGSPERRQDRRAIYKSWRKEFAAAVGEDQARAYIDKMREHHKERKEKRGERMGERGKQDPAEGGEDEEDMEEFEEEYREAN